MTSGIQRQGARAVLRPLALLVLLVLTTWAVLAPNPADARPRRPIRGWPAAAEPLPDPGKTPEVPVTPVPIPPPPSSEAHRSGLDIDWVRHARVGGLGLAETISDGELEVALKSLVRQKATVVEIDSSFSEYLSDEDFAYALDFVRKVVKKAHEKGLRVAWYYPTLEVITYNGRLLPHTMRKDHPDWIQRNFDRMSFNAFLGTLAFWVRPDDESAWMCPNSPYRQYFQARLERLAATGVDAVWVDVPLLSSIAGKWPCSDRHCMERFQAETGHRFPNQLDYRNRDMRAWVQWRHQNLADFLSECAARVRRVNPHCRTVVEVVTCDYLLNTVDGLDATWFDRGLDIVWEVDVISDTTSMTHASLPDWLCLLQIYKYCQGASRQRSRWAFTYGYRDADAQLVMASALAAQLNPYETRIPQMVTTVGEAYRERMFTWIADHSREIYDATSTASVALVYSPQSRDFVDGTLRGGGLYVTPVQPYPALYWQLEPDQSVLVHDFMAEYRGWGMLLIQNQVPFDVVTTNQMDAETLRRYKVLVLPQAAALSDDQRDLLAAYARAGGTLIVTGDKSGRYDGTGARRPSNAWATWWKKGTGGQAPSEAAVEQGRAFFCRRSLGSEYLRCPSEKGLRQARDLVARAGVSPALLERAPAYVQTYEEGGRSIVHLLNLGWVGRRPPLVPRASTFKVGIPWSGAPTVRVTLSEPGAPPRELLAEVREGRVVFEAPVSINALIVVEASR